MRPSVLIMSQLAQVWVISQSQDQMTHLMLHGSQKCIHHLGPYKTSKLPGFEHRGNGCTPYTSLAVVAMEEQNWNA